MDLYERLQGDMKTAMKSGEAVKLSVLRMLVSAIKLLEIDKKLKKIENADVLQILQKQIKQHRDSIEQFEKGNRQDLADKEKSELVILETYMPKQMTEAELAVMIKEVIAETGATSKKDTGKVMKLVLEKAKGTTDGKSVNQALMKILMCIVIAFCVTSASTSYAADELAKKETFVQKTRKFIQKLFSYPANVTQGSANVAADTSKHTAEVVTKEVETTSQVAAGDVDKTKEMVTGPLTGASETALNAVENASKIPEEAVKEQ